MENECCKNCKSYYINIAGGNKSVCLNEDFYRENGSASFTGPDLLCDKYQSKPLVSAPDYIESLKQQLKTSREFNLASYNLITDLNKSIDKLEEIIRKNDIIIDSLKSKSGNFPKKRMTCLEESHFKGIVDKFLRSCADGDRLIITKDNDNQIIELEYLKHMDRYDIKFNNTLSHNHIFHHHTLKYLNEVINLAWPYVIEKLTIIHNKKKII